MNKPLIDEEMILRTMDVFLAPGQVCEVRAMQAQMQGEKWPGTVSGYFNDSKRLVEALGQIEFARGIYVTLNPVKPDLLARANNRLKRVEKGEATSDGEILSRRWLLVDVDAVRPSGISSTEGEHQAALRRTTRLPEAARTWLARSHGG